MVTNGKKIFDLAGAEAVYTTCEYQMRYITGMAAENGAVVVDKDGVTLYTDSRYIEAAEKLFVGSDVTAVLHQQGEAVERLKK